MRPGAARLLRLYPLPWRERYGEEFLAVLGNGPLRVQQVIDIVSGAIDAWLSADVRRATGTCPVASSEGGSMNVKALTACRASTLRFTTRDELIGAGVMILATLIFMALGVAARRQGWLVTGEALTDVAFPASLMLSMPFWLMKGQPWKAQTAVVGTTVILLLAMGFLAASS